MRETQKIDKVGSSEDRWSQGLQQAFRGGNECNVDQASVVWIEGRRIVRKESNNEEIDIQKVLKDKKMLKMPRIRIFEVLVLLQQRQPIVTVQH